MAKGRKSGTCNNSKEEAEKIFAENERLIWWCLQRYKIPPDDIDDCYQEAAWGLYYCALHFDKNAGCNFATYAVPSMSGRVQRYLRERRNAVKQSRKTIDNTFKIAKYTEEHNIDDSTYLNWKQCEELGISTLEYMDVIQSKSTASLNDRITLKDDTSAELGDMIPCKSNIDELFEDGYTLVDDFINYYRSTPHYSEVRENIFKDACDNIIVGYGTRQRELAEKYGLSQSYISRIIMDMFKRFKIFYTRNYIKDGDLIGY